MVTRENVQGTPDLMIEILSPATRHHDERTKRTLDERFQVPEYWIIDPDLETVKIHRLMDGRYPVPEELTTEQAHPGISTPILPGFSVTPQAIFR